MNPKQNNYRSKLGGQNHINFTSADGLVQVVTKTVGARRFPQHNYPVVCLRFRVAKGSRIQSLEGGQGWEVLMTHREVAAHLSALNAADAKSNYTWREIPEKPAARKAYWDKVNQDRRHKLKGGEK